MHFVSHLLLIKSRNEITEVSCSGLSQTPGKRWLSWPRGFESHHLRHSIIAFPSHICYILRMSWFDRNYLGKTFGQVVEDYGIFSTSDYFATHQEMSLLRVLLPSLSKNTPVVYFSYTESYADDNQLCLKSKKPATHRS